MLDAPVDDGEDELMEFIVEPDEVEIEDVDMLLEAALDDAELLVDDGMGAVYVAGVTPNTEASTAASVPGAESSLVYWEWK